MPKPNVWAPLMRMRDWNGRQVKLLRDAQNKAGVTIRAGEVCTATGYPRGRLILSAPWLEGQERIGGSSIRWMRGIPVRDVQLIS